MEVEEELIERAVELLDGIPGWLVEFGYTFPLKDILDGPRESTAF
ncbi:ATPase 1 [Pyrococcus furiosus COM1]|uniref:ATPase 1 n=1 Tax=Pyrococcus furiosus COM1 TaxID=1185654 RepID=I6U6K6_9EURY|nr:ATPase 1 [Pyrococcus furiosus COM1]